MLKTACTKMMDLKNIRTVMCSTCLSSDRCLYSMRILPQLLNICNGITKKSLAKDRVYPNRLGLPHEQLSHKENVNLNVEQNICWECKAQLLKMHKFRQKAIKAQSILTCLSGLEQLPTQQHVIVQSLSTLTESELLNFEVNLGVEVKTEVPEFDITPEEDKDLDQTVSREPREPSVDEKLIKEVEETGLLTIKSELDWASSPDSDNACDVTVPPSIDKVEGINLKSNNECNFADIPGRDKLEGINLKSNNECNFADIPGIDKVEGINLKSNNECNFADIPGRDKLEGINLKSNNECNFADIPGRDKLEGINLKSNNECNFADIPGRDKVEGINLKSKNECKITDIPGRDKLDGFTLSSDNECDVTEPPGKDNLDGFTLKTMDEEEMLRFMEKVRRRSRYKNTKYKCEKCILTFPNELSMVKHNEKHYESNGPFTCRVCEQRFQYDSALQTHIQGHYKCYECEGCSFSHQLLHNMFLHRRRKHEDRIRKCNKCEAQFNSHQGLRNHRRKEHFVRPHCDLCYKKFSQVHYLKRHMLMEHMTEVPMVECTVCHKQYRGEWGLEAHMRTHTNTVHENAYCAECNTQYKNIYLYRQHLKTTRRHVDPEFDKFECSDCGKKYLQKRSLQLHIEVEHLKQKNHVCDICKAKFYARITLYRHKRDKHSGAKSRRHVCHICGKAFTTKQTLKQHTNSHLGVRPYKCKICGDTFTYSGALSTHNKLVHLKQKRANRTGR